MLVNKRLARRSTLELGSASSKGFADGAREGSHAGGGKEHIEEKA
jgi:hypothetical protein